MPLIEGKANESRLSGTFTGLLIAFPLWLLMLLGASTIGQSIPPRLAPIAVITLFFLPPLAILLFAVRQRRNGHSRFAQGLFISVLLLALFAGGCLAVGISS